jgi:hypothetical protein
MINRKLLIRMYEELNSNKKILAIDFDGTIVEFNNDINSIDFKFKENFMGVWSYIKENFYTILWTCRGGNRLNDVLNFLNNNNIIFDSVNKNASFLDFETSNKIYADIYIDDRILGYEIDWLKIKEQLKNLL